ncbi:MAG: hypothetical protein ACRDYY_16370, partial [Acidimicrobiales bacterium]
MAAHGRRGASLGGDWSGLVVMVAGTSWDGNRFPEHHMAMQLSRYAPVLFVDPPLSPVTVRRHPELAPSAAGPALRCIGPRLARLTTVVLPGKDRTGVSAVTDVLLRRSLRRALRALGSPSVSALVVVGPRPILGCAREALSVYYAYDDFGAGASLMGVPQRRLHRVEREVALRADVVVAASASQAERWRASG